MHTEDHHFLESAQKLSVSRVAPAGAFCPPPDPMLREQKCRSVKKDVARIISAQWK
jgi:hypothetical protein